MDKCFRRANIMNTYDFPTTFIRMSETRQPLSYRYKVCHFQIKEILSNHQPLPLPLPPSAPSTVVTELLRYLADLAGDASKLLSTSDALSKLLRLHVTRRSSSSRLLLSLLSFWSSLPDRSSLVLDSLRRRARLVDSASLSIESSRVDSLCRLPRPPLFVCYNEHNGTLNFTANFIQQFNCGQWPKSLHKRDMITIKNNFF